MNEKPKSIPVLGTAIVNTVSWLEKLIDSVDYPTDEFVIINNNGRGELTQSIDELCKQKHSYIKKFSIVHMPRNTGCAGAWNTIIKCYMNSPFWIIANHDIEFPTGFLSVMLDYASNPLIGTVHGQNGPNHLMGGYSLFLIRDWVVRDFGLFDENFYPGYSEDTDYEMRFVHRPIMRQLSVNIPYKHGGTFDYGTSGSQTWRQDMSLKDKIDNGRYINEHEYMNSKWGEGWRWLQPYKHPFNNESYPIGYTTYDLNFVRRKNLGF